MMIRSFLSTILKHTCNNNVICCRIHRCLALPNNIRNLPVTSNENFTLRKDIEQQGCSPQETLTNLQRFAYERKFVSVYQIECLINDIKTHGALSDVQTVFILKCCGNLAILSDKKSRAEIMNSVWQLYKEMKITVTLNHFNTLLQTVIDNEIEIDIENILKEIADAGIKPNNETYLKLHTYYCEVGDTEEADKLFKMLQQTGVQLNEETFNSVMIGHGRAKDLDEALNAVSMMKAHDIEVTSLTLETILQIYSELGKEKEVETILSNSSGISISSKCLLDAHYSFMKNNNKMFAEKILSIIPPDLSTSLVAPVVLELLQLKEYEAAYKLVHFGLNKSDSHKYTYFATFLGAHVPIDVALTYCGKLMESNTNVSAFEILLLSFLNIKDAESSFKVLQEMKKRKVEIKEHYLYPLICSLKWSESDDLSGLLRILRYDNCREIEIYLHFVFPFMKLSDPLHTYALLSKHIDNSLIPTALFLHLLKLDRVQEASDFLSSVDFALPNFQEVYTILCRSYVALEQESLFGSIIANGLRLINNNHRTEVSQVSIFLKNLVTALHRANTVGKEEKLYKLLQVLVELKVQLPKEDGVDLLQNTLSYMSPPIKECIKKMMVTDDLSQPPGHKRDTEDPSIQAHRLRELERNISISESKNSPANLTTLQEALKCYLETESYDKADAMYKKILSSAAFISISQHLLMAELYYRRGNYQSVVDTMSHIYASEPGAVFNGKHILRYASSLIEIGKVIEAADIILGKKCHELRTVKYEIVNLADAIVLSLSKTANQEECDTVLDALLKKGYCTKILTRKASIYKLLQQKKLSTAIAEFTNAYGDIGVLICERELLQESIRSIQNLKGSYNVSLQYINRFILSKKGRKWADSRLVMAYIECDELQKARNMLQAERFVIVSAVLQETLHNWHRSGKLDHFNIIFSVARDSSDSLKQFLYDAVTKFCLSRNEKEKAMEIYELALSDNIQLSTEFLQTKTE